MVTTIALGSTRVPIGELSACLCVRLTNSWLCLVFFFKRLESFFFLLKLLALPTASIHCSNNDKGLKCRFRLSLDIVIKHFVSAIQFLIPTIYLGLNGWPWALFEIPNHCLFVKNCNGIKLFKYVFKMFWMSNPV